MQSSAQEAERLRVRAHELRLHLRGDRWAPARDESRAWSSCARSL
jgi:hypothetical protein